MSWLSTVWSGVTTWFGGVNMTLIMGIITAAMVLFSGVALTKCSSETSRADAAIQLANNNAAQAEMYKKLTLQAEDAAGRERARAEQFAEDNQKLKEQVDAIAKGSASPGVDFAVRGVQPSGSKAVAPKLPGRAR